MSDRPRLRIAPSPTGMMHVGNVRTALFNWLYARHTGGQFLVRIEDTDAARDKEEWVDAIFESLKWIGLDWDEEPGRQSRNHDAHVVAAQTLYENGNAYYCDCTREVVDSRTKANATPGYDRFCRDRNLGPGEGRALRFRVPEGHTLVHDLVRGDVDFDNRHVEDFVIVRSTGVPMYVLANAVDDFNDRITHVVRGEEHLPNTPKQMMIWSTLGAGELPTYAHLPLIVNETRKKLSKRRDKVALESYRAEGYLPEAMRNFLALLGWGPKGDREIVPLQTLIDEFDFADVQKSSAFFDVKKLDHFNGEYIRALSLEDFIERSQPFLEATTAWPKENFDAGIYREMAPLVQERIVRLDEIPAMVDFLFIDEVVYGDDAKKSVQDETIREIYAVAVEAFESSEWTSAALHNALLTVGEARGVKLGKAQAPVRFAITGKKVGPPLFESMQALGRERAMARLRRFTEVASVA